MKAFCRIITLGSVLKRSALKRPRLGGIFLVIGIGILACRGERTSRESDSLGATTPATSEDSMALGVNVWDSAIGKVIVLSMADGSDSVMILEPDYVQDRYSDSATFDLRRISGTHIELFGRSGAFGTSVLTAGLYQRSSEEGCVSWPTGGILGSRPGWAVGLEKGHATTIPLDSIEGMRSVDSARFAVEITRIAARIPETNDRTFSIVPFLVLRGYRYRSGEIDGIVGVVRRNIPSEADPREERVFFIAERSGKNEAAEYRVVFVDREVSDGEAPRSVDVLALVRLGDRREMMIVSFMYNDGGSIGIVERGVGKPQWEGNWESAYVGC